MANDSNIIIKITSEADLTDAQLQLKDLQDESKRLQKEMQDLSRIEKEDADSIKQLNLSVESQNKALKQNEQYYRDLKKAKQEEVNANEKSIQSLKKSVSSYNAVNNSGKQLMTRIREIRNALSEMEMAGDTSSQAFIDMSVEAAKLQDQMGDTSAQIRILASDTKEIDAMIDVAGGLTGVFTTATSAVALFTDENEALQKAFLKVQAAMSVLNGIQQVANTLNKDSAANVVLRTTLTKLFSKAKKEETVAETTNTTATVANTAATNAGTAATTAATTATKGFTKALLSNPIMLVVAALALLVGGLMAAYEWFKDGAKEAREYEKALKDLEKAQTKQAIEMSKINKERANSLNALKKAEHEYEQEANKNNASEKERLKKSIEFAKQREDIMIKSLKAEQKALQDSFDELTETKKKAEAQYNAVGSIENYIKMKDATIEYNESLQRQNEIISELATIDQERLQLEEDLKNKIIERKKEERDMKIALMKDGSKKEIAEVNARYDDERKTIIQKYGKNTTLLKGLETQRQEELKNIRDKYSNEFLRLEDEYNVLISEIASAENPFNKTLDIVEVKAKATAAINDIKRQIEDLQANGGENSVEMIRNLNAEIKRIETETNQTVKGLEQDAFAEKKNIANLELQQEINKNNNILQNERMKHSERKNLIQETSNMELQQINNEMSVNENAYQQGLISYETYLQKKVELEEKYNNEIAETNKELEAEEQRVIQEKLQYAQMALQTLGQIADEIFGAIQDKISREMEALDEMYTTDAEEAKNNANKKYISEKELENKKLELKRKAAAAEKAQAIFSIGLNTAMAIMNAATTKPFVPLGAAMVALVSALGATQLAVALSKPLPQYAKGRKGGKGEYALVGERGPEVMYIPQGASIIPNNKLESPDTWGDYGIPKANIPQMNTISTEQLAMTMMLGMNAIDYNRLGKAVADNIKIPQQNAVSVNIDRSGISVTNKGETHTYLNKKYSAQWN
jgi:hypothetical protein